MTPGATSLSCRATLRRLHTIPHHGFQLLYFTSKYYQNKMADVLHSVHAVIILPDNFEIEDEMIAYTLHPIHTSSSQLNGTWRCFSSPLAFLWVSQTEILEHEHTAYNQSDM